MTLTPCGRWHSPLIRRHCLGRVLLPRGAWARSAAFALLLVFFSLEPSWGDGTSATTRPSTSPTVDAAVMASTSSPKIITLQQCIDSALTHGNQNAINQKTLDISKAKYNQTVADNSVSLKSSLGYGVTQGFGSDSLLSAYSSTVGTSSTSLTPQEVTGSLSLSGASTSLSASGSYLVSLADQREEGGLVGLSLTQEVWDGCPGGTAAANIRKGKLNFELAKLTADSDRRSLIYEIKQDYYNMLGAQRDIEVYEQNLEKQKAALEQEQTLYDLHEAEDVDLQTAKINVKSAEVDLQSGRLELLTARKTLANLVGFDSTEDFTVAETDDPQITVQSLQEAVSIGLANREELKEVGMNRRIGDVSLALLKAQTSPTVSVTGGGYLVVDSLGNSNAQTLSLGCSIGLPILDSGSTAYQEAANRYQKDIYDLQEDQYRRSIALAVENAYNTFQLRKQKLELAELTAQNAEGQYELKKLQRQYGTATNQDVLTASVTLINDRTALATARNDLSLAVLALQSAMGL